ncbi:MAG TPA: hypothetical protein VIK53_01280 [Verrucomicrobiae bacterium]
MKKLLLAAFAALPLLLSSCATPPPPQAYHTTDNNALIIESLDDRTSQILQPSASPKIPNDQVLTKAHAFPQHLTAVVILENCNEPRLGGDFRDRSTTWFVGLRSLGYAHIYFLQGNGISNPEGLITLAKYD